MPDINWDQMVLYHKHIFAKLYDIIVYEVEVNNFDITIEPHLLTSHQLKNVMFDRVMLYGTRFRMGYHMNDLITFHIINPYSDNLKELVEILSVNQALRINFKTNDNGHIRLVGKTDLGTQYEINLWTTLISQWAKWSTRNRHLPRQVKLRKLRQIEKQQQIMDRNRHIR